MTTDFVAGMMYEKIENGMAAILSKKYNIDKFPFEIHGFNPVFWEKVIYKSTLVDNVVKIVTNEFNKKYGDSYSIEIKSEFPYTKTDFETLIIIKKKEPEYKEMTIADVEKELGYKIKIINN